MDKVKLIQLNMGRGRRSLDLITRHLIDTDTSIALIQEPYTTTNNKIPTMPRTIVVHEKHNDQQHTKSAILTNNKLIHLRLLHDLSTPNIITTKLQTTHSRSDIYFISGYFEKTEPIELYLNEIDRIGKEIDLSRTIISIDGNARSTTWFDRLTNHRGDELEQWICASNLYILNEESIVSKNTFDSHQGSSNVDLTLAGEEVAQHITNWQISESESLSDHNSITFTLNLGFTSLQKPNTNYNFKKADWKKFNTALSHNFSSSKQMLETIEAVQTADELNTQVNKFTASIIAACNLAIPKCKLKAVKCPWWNEKLEEKSNRLTALRKRIHRTQSPEILALIKFKYKTERAAYKKYILDAKTNSWTRFCEVDNMTNVYNKIYRILKVSKPNINNINNLTIETDTSTLTLTDPKKIQDELLSHHINHNNPSKLERKFQGKDDPLITMTEIQEQINNLNVKKAPGPDRIAGIVIKKTFIQRKHIILAIFNSSLRIGLFPNKWKESDLIFLKKPSTNTQVTPRSFRPICLINIFAKIFEKIIHNRITHYMDNNFPLDSKQHGFRKGGSTVAACTKLMNFIDKSKTKRQDIAVVSLDVAGAFDNVIWDNIIDELVSRSLPSNICRLINSYFQNRQVYNTLNGHKTSRMVVQGCPQGTVLGPFFWCVLMDRLLQTLDNTSSTEIIAYADDLLIAITGKNIRDMEHHFKDIVQKIETWCTEFNMKINTKKSSALLISNKNKLELPNYYIQNNKIEFKKSLKYLGITFDCKLKFYTHIKTQTDKARQLLQKMSFVARQTWGLKSGQIEGLYKGVILPIVTYGCEIWHLSLTHKRNALMLKQIQRLAAIRKLRAYRTTSHNASIALSGFTPILEKIKEIVEYHTCKTNKFIIINNIKVPIETAIAQVSRHPTKHPIIRLFSREDDSCMDLTIYTDGSKNDKGTGCAFVMYEMDEEILNRKVKLSAHCSAYQAELMAIVEALNRTLIIKDRLVSWKILIRSDSLSALKAINNTQCVSPLVRRVHELLWELQESAVYVFFEWVRGHEGVVGNERADFLAKESINCKTGQKYKDISHRTLKHMLRQQTTQTLHSTYKNFSEDSFSEFFPTYDSLSTFLKYNTFNFIDIQFITGHGNFNQYLHRFKIIDCAACPCDNQSTQNVKHLIFNCSNYDIERNKLIETLRTKYKIIWPPALHTFTQNQQTYKHFHRFIEHIYNTQRG